MALSSFILFPHGPTWQIAGVAGGHVAFTDLQPPAASSESPPARAVAERLAEELNRLGYAGQGVVLAMPAADCLAASIDTAGLPRGDRKAMLYRLEEKLPMAAESIVADFIPAEGRALGVCVREDTVSPLVHALESCGVAVQSVAPAALLAAQQLADADHSQVLLIGEDDRVNVVPISHGAAIGWSLLPARPADVKLHLRMISLESGEDWPARACGLEAELLEGLGASSVPVTPRQDAAIAGAAILDGRLKPWVEFRRGSLAIADPMRLHRAAIEALLTAAAIFLVCLTAGLFWRAHRYQAEAQSAERRMADEFSATFPGWPRQANVRTVVESERRKLGSRGSTALPAARDSAVAMLYSVLSRLPGDVKFKFESLGFTDSTFEMQGRVRNFADVDAMASAARLAGTEVPPPQAHRDAEGFWNFTMRGTKGKK